MKKTILQYVKCICCAITFLWMDQVYAAQTGDEGMSLLWHMDEYGVVPEALDSTTNNLNGTSFGNIRGGHPSISYTAFENFTSTESFVANSAIASATRAFSYMDWTFTAWIKNPDFLASNIRLIARGANSRFGQGSDVPWQTWLDNEGRVYLSVQTSSGKRGITNSIPLTWEEDTWYHFAVVQEYSNISGIRKEHFKIYVTPYGEDSVGSPVIDWSYSNAYPLSNGKSLVVGAGAKGYYSEAPAGFFGGQIDEVSFWRGTALTEAELNESLMSFIPKHRPLEEVALVLLHMDEQGTTPDLSNAITNTINGISTGNVFGGESSPQGTAFGGFTSTDSLVAVTNMTTGNTFSSSDWSFLAWVKNPVLAENKIALIARGASVRYGDNSNVPWQIGIDENGAISMSIQTWSNGIVGMTNSVPLTWERNQWYQISVIEDFSKDGSTYIENFKVYVTPGGENSCIGEPVIDWTYKSISGLASGSTLVVGGGKDGYYYRSYGIAQAGFFGGTIDEVSFSTKVLKTELLNENLKLFRAMGSVFVLQ